MNFYSVSRYFFRKYFETLQLMNLNSSFIIIIFYFHDFFISELRRKQNDVLKFISEI